MLVMKVGYKVKLTAAQMRSLAECEILSVSVDDIKVSPDLVNHLTPKAAEHVRIVSSSGIELKALEISNAGDYILEVVSIPDDAELV